MTQRESIDGNETVAASQEPLSEFWREHRSDKVEEELTYVLEAARGYLGFFGSDFSVDWGKGSSMEADKNKIILDFAPLQDKMPPYDGIDVDKVMGAAIHECGHVKWSYPAMQIAKMVERLWRSSKPHPVQNYHYNQVDKEMMCIANIIEDFYVENKVSERYPTLGAYLHEARKYQASREKMPQKVIDDLATDNPAFDFLVAMWGSICLLDDQIPASASDVTRHCLNELIEATMKTAKSSAKKRITITRKIWERLQAFQRAHDKEMDRQAKAVEEASKAEASQMQGESTPTEKPEGGKTEGEPEASQPQEDEEDTGEDEAGVSEESEEGEEESTTDKEKPEDTTADEPYQSLEDLAKSYTMPTNAKVYLPDDLKEAVDEYQEKRPIDITQEVQSIVGGTAGEQIRLELAGSNSALASRYRADTYKIAIKLSRIFQFDKRLRTRYGRALMEGAVDGRRLAKAGATDYKLFKRKEVLSAPSLAVTILVDSSGSMVNRIQGVMQMAMAFKTAFDTIPNISLSVIAYKGDRYDNCTKLLRVYDRGTGAFRAGVEGEGGTPSGYAIAGAASQMLKTLHGKDKLLVHLTDGCPDTYEEVSKAVKYCNENRIDVMTLTTVSLPDEAIEAYHGFVERINDFNELPDRISKLLKRRLQKQLLKIR